MALSTGFRDSVSLLPAIRATRLWLLPRWDCLPPNVSAFSGYTTGQAVFPHSALQWDQLAKTARLPLIVTALVVRESAFQPEQLPGAGHASPDAGACGLETMLLAQQQGEVMDIQSAPRSLAASERPS